jgi:hypothetical protein
VLQLNAERAVPVAEGSYRWRGELRMWDTEALIGWYRSTNAAVRSKGNLYPSLHQLQQERGLTSGSCVTPWGNEFCVLHPNFPLLLSGAGHGPAGACLQCHSSYSTLAAMVA